MSPENVEIARRALMAFAEQDVEAWVECADADVEMLFESAWLVEIRDGKIIYFRPYQSHLEALEAAGLSE